MFSDQSTLGVSESLFQDKTKTVHFWKRTYFFFGTNIFTQCKMLCKKSFEKFFDTQNNFFVQDTFLEKKFKNILKRFSQKCPPKKTFFECQKIFQNLFLITFYIFLKIFGPKKVSTKLLIVKNDQIWFCPEIRITSRTQYTVYTALDLKTWSIFFRILLMTYKNMKPFFVFWK